MKRKKKIPTSMTHEAMRTTEVRRKKFFLLFLLILSIPMILLFNKTSGKTESNYDFVYTEGTIIGQDGEPIYVDILHASTISSTEARRTIGAKDEQAYVLTGLKRTKQPTQFSYNPTSSTGPDTSQSLVEHGFSGWNGFTPNFSYALNGLMSNGGNLCESTFSNNGTGNTISWGVRGANILATACWDPSKDECDIVIDTRWDWKGSIDLQTVILHESGHCLGLGHSTDGSAVMAPSYHGVMRVPGPDDRAGLCALYGGCSVVPPTPTRTPTQAPTVAPTATRTPVPVTPSPTPSGPPVYILYAGWNLLVSTYATAPDEIRIANPCISTIYFWNQPLQEWNGWFYQIGGVFAGDLLALPAGQAFWAYCK